MSTTARALVRALGAFTLLVVLFAATATGQTPAAAPVVAPALPDVLGRDSPRGSVLGFLNVARKGENELAAEYLSTPLKGAAAATLAHQLYVVLDARLPARLTLVSDAPEGSRANPLKPNEDTVGTVAGADGPVDIVMERVPGLNAKPIWLFSARTLNAVPTLFNEVNLGLGEGTLPRILTGTRVGGVRVLEWLIVLLGLPLLYLVTLLLDRLLRPAAAGLWGRLFKHSMPFATHVLPLPIRLLVVAAAMRWLLSSLPLALMIRQFGATIATLISIAAVVWLMILLNEEVEAYVIRRFPRARVGAAQSLVRLARRGVDLLAIFMGVLVTLRHFRRRSDARACRARRWRHCGGARGAENARERHRRRVAHLRSGGHRGRLPEDGRDLRYGRPHRPAFDAHPHPRSDDRERAEQPDRQRVPGNDLGTRQVLVPPRRRASTTRPRPTSCAPSSMASAALLASHPLAERDSVRVRFLRLGTFSLDVDVFAYLRTVDWNHFLELQESLLFGITDIVARAGAEIAFPSQTMRVDKRSDAVRRSVKGEEAV